MSTKRGIADMVGTGAASYLVHDPLLLSIAVASEADPATPTIGLSGYGPGFEIRVFSRLYVFDG